MAACASGGAWRDKKPDGEEERVPLPIFICALLAAGMRTPGHFLAAFLAAVVAVHARAQATSLVDELAAGRVGSLQIGMSQREVESLLGRRIELDEFLDFPFATNIRPTDLQSLGIKQVAGIPSSGVVDLQFDNPLKGDRHLRYVSISIRCDHIGELARRLDYENASKTPLYYSDRKPPYAWDLYGSPGCSVHLWLNTDRMN